MSSLIRARDGLRRALATDARFRFPSPALHRTHRPLTRGYGTWARSGTCGSATGIPDGVARSGGSQDCVIPSRSEPHLWGGDSATAIDTALKRDGIRACEVRASRHFDHPDPAEAFHTEDSRPAVGALDQQLQWPGHIPWTRPSSEQSIRAGTAPSIFRLLRSSPRLLVLGVPAQPALSQRALQESGSVPREGVYQSNLRKS